MAPRRLAPQAIRLLVAALLSTAACATACAAPTATLHATLTPEQLGQRTTIGFSFKIDTPTNQVPSPLTKLDISYPAGLAFALSELGLATCSTQALETFGIEGCPPNSLMGYGTALAEVPLGPSITSEAAKVTIFRASNRSGHLTLLIYVNAPTPVSGQFILPALLMPAETPYGGRFDVNIPLITSLPGGYDVAVTQFRTTLGPLHLHYHEHKHGHTIKYQPKGIPLPNHCPHGGFQFAATFAFQDGSHTKAKTTVNCPSKASTAQTRLESDPEVDAVALEAGVAAVAPAGTVVAEGQAFAS